MVVVELVVQSLSMEKVSASAPYQTPYSHLSNKREVTLIDFAKKIHPPRLLIS